MDKRYYSKVKGAKFIQPDGHEMIFAYGFFEFKDADYQDIYVGASEKDPRNGKLKSIVYQAELEAILKQKGGNPLFFDQSMVQGLSTTPSPIPQTGPDGRAIQNARSAAEIAAQDASLAGTRHQVSGDPNKGTIETGGGDPNASTLDHNLVKTVANFSHGDSSSRAEQIRAAAAARNATSISK